MNDMEELLKDLREVCEKHKMGIKFGQSPIEVKRVNYRHRISDDTHDKVYALNKQMCDIDKHLSEAGYFRMICDGQIETWKKLKDMEEKKTKKMTKAEAFEYLKHKKVEVTCDAYLLQDKLFEIGYRWCDGSIDKLPMIDFLFIDDETFQFTELLSHFKKYAYEEISADDILSIEIVEEGLSYDKVVELAKPLMHYLNEVGCRDSIRVSQLGIVHEPMSTLVFDNGIGRIE